MSIRFRDVFCALALGLACSTTTAFASEAPESTPFLPASLQVDGGAEEVVLAADGEKHTRWTDMSDKKVRSIKRTGRRRIIIGSTLIGLGAATMITGKALNLEFDAGPATIRPQGAFNLVGLVFMVVGAPVVGSGVPKLINANKELKRREQISWDLSSSPTFTPSAGYFDVPRHRARRPFIRFSPTVRASQQAGAGGGMLMFGRF